MYDNPWRIQYTTTIVKQTLLSRKLKEYMTMESKIARAIVCYTFDNNHVSV